MKNPSPKLPPRPICAGPIFLLLSAVAVATCLAPSTGHGATLLASPAMTGSFGSSGPAAGFSDTGGGRVGGALQPLGTASVSSSQPAFSQAAVVQPGGGTRGGGEEQTQVSTRVRRQQQSEPAPRRRRVQEETEAPEPRSHPGGTVSTASTSNAPRIISNGKEAKTEVLATTAQNPWHAELGVGYYTDYQSFRGVNILDVVTSEHGGSGGVIFSSFKLGYARQHDSLTLGFNYWQALNRAYPKGPIYDVPPNSTSKDNAKFRLPSRDRYEEYNTNITYTRNFFDDKVAASVGYNHFSFSNGAFWKGGSDATNIAYANEIMVGLAYTALPYIQPSISYSNDLDGFIGSYLEMRIDGAFDLYQRGEVSARLRPYVAVSYDFAYNGTDNGWNAVEFGLNVPIRLNSFLTWTFTGNYVLPLEKTGGDQPRASDGLWGGVKLTVDWGGPSPDLKNLPLSGKDKDAKIVVSEPGEKPWEVSVGAGWRKVDFSYNHRNVDAFPVSSLYDPRVRTGDLGFAVPGTRRDYDNGVVDARFPSGGTAPFAVKNADPTDPNTQIIGTPGNNAQVRFSTSDYAYRQTGERSSGASDDTDSMFSPFITLDRELWRAGAWSLRGGLLYAFTGTSSDSGYRLARLDTVTQTTNTFGFVYSFDNANFANGTSTNRVVVDPAAYSLLTPGVAPAGLIPKSDLTEKTQNIVSVGTFVRSSVSLDSHDLAIPISFRYDFGNRIHAEVTVAPTVTLANAELRTEIESRSFTNFPAPRSETRNGVKPLPPVTSFGGRTALGGAFMAPAVQPPPAAQTQAPQNNNQATGGKSSTPQNPRYPGTLLAKSLYTDNTNAFLFGVSAGGSIILDLNQEKTFFAELYGKYHWVQDFALDDGFGQSRVDLSSVQVGLGLGYRF